MDRQPAYLTHQEIETLNLIVSAYLDFAELQARSRQADRLSQAEAEAEERGGMIGGLKPYPEYKNSGVPWLKPAEIL